MLGNILLFLIIAVIIGGALAKLVSDKKKGVPCSGCPYSKSAAGECSCSDDRQPVNYD